MRLSFENAAQDIIKEEPEKTAQEYPELFQWKDITGKKK
jgi:hypothetical protein